MIYFTEEQINYIVNEYKKGRTLQDISKEYNVSRPTIQKVLKQNYPLYTGKKRAAKASKNQTKKCTKCNKELPLSSFNVGNSLYGRRSYCRECEKIIQRSPEKVARRRELENERRKNQEYVLKCNKRDRLKVHSNKISYIKAMLRATKQRAKIKNLEFNLTLDDIILPDVCPLLNIPLSINSSDKDYSYSIDRIDNSKGYTKDNIFIISNRANRIKNNAKLEELELLVLNLKKYLNGFIKL